MHDVKKTKMKSNNKLIMNYHWLVLYTVRLHFKYYSQILAAKSLLCYITGNTRGNLFLKQGIVSIHF